MWWCSRRQSACDGAAEAEPGPGRDMGPGWLEGAADALADEASLPEWAEIAREHDRAVTGARR
ncbi:hypothetical protein BCONGLO52_13400 [Brachybacterium conglomeratum]|uniref:Uncharacterized protein n=1 Tax=Brachybacterium conglomeratum TaxID=47846 RepID=A0ABQ5RF46_9MICO|nr:hypothetical protein BCONGLO52_13400 [Brachybacterium conglomeratum]GLK05013.1 hypothetical protein GCM10017597_18130 [Brachybacterium conglomeratum]